MTPEAQRTGPVVLIPLALVLSVGCIAEPMGSPPARRIVKVTALANVLRSWDGGYPVSDLDLLPAAVRTAAVGYISDPDTLAAVWAVFQPGLPPPDVDFTQEIILFVRNVDFYNQLSIIQVPLDQGVARPVVRTTHTATPITDTVAMSMVLVERYGIVGVE